MNNSGGSDIHVKYYDLFGVSSQMNVHGSETEALLVIKWIFTFNSSDGSARCSFSKNKCTYRQWQYTVLYLNPIKPTSQTVTNIV